MGMTPLEGLIVATRSGSVDPGILLAVRQRHTASPAADLGTCWSAAPDCSASPAPPTCAKCWSDPSRVMSARAWRSNSSCARWLASIAAATTALPRLVALVFTDCIGEGSRPHACPCARGSRRWGSPAWKRVTWRSMRCSTVAKAAIPPCSGSKAREDLVVAGEVRALLRAASGVASVTEAPVSRLSSDAARRRLARDGPSGIARRERFSAARELATLVTNPLIVILLLASAVSAAVGEVVNATVISRWSRWAPLCRSSKPIARSVLGLRKR